MQNRERSKQPNWFGLVLVLLIVAPEITVPIGILAGIGYVVYQLVKAKASHTGSQKKITYTRKAEALDDCLKQLFCFHKDKAEHHLSRGKEIDPWDRPDIDIRKYQRKE